jgi:hypothetical protein
MLIAYFYNVNPSAVNSQIILSFAHPLRCRLNFGSDRRTGIFPPASGKAADRPHRHVLIDHDLAAQANSRKSPGGQQIFLGDRDLFRFPGQKLDPASRAAGIAAAGMQLINPGVFGQCQDEAFSNGNFERSGTFDG